MAKSGRVIGGAERALSLAVLAVLFALAAWMLTERGRLNPGVEVFLRAPALKAAEGSAAPGAGGGEAGLAPAEQDAQAGGGKASGLAALLPDEIPGLKPLTAVERFNPATLSDRIDGKAELYLAAGFSAMACRSYQTGNTRIEAFLYRMKTPDAAFAVFSGQRRPGAAQSPLAKNAYLTENAIFFTSGADYLELIADRAGARVPLEALAKTLLAGLGGGEGGQAAGKDGAAKAAPQDLFPRAGLKADSIRLAVADAFGCQGLTSVYTAEYDQSAGGVTLFLSRRKDGAEAAAQLALYGRFLADNGYGLNAKAAGAPEGAQVLAMEGSVEIVFVRGAMLAGVHDAPDLDTALRAAKALDGALSAVSLAPKTEAKGK